MKYFDAFSWSLFRVGKTLELRVLGPRRPDREVDRAYTGVDAERNGLRCRPQKRPIGGRDSDPDAMTGGKAVGYIVELDSRFAAFTGNKRIGKFVALAMAEIEHAIADQCRDPIGKDVIEAHNRLGYRAVAVEHEPELGHAEDFQRIAQRLGIKDQRPAVIHLLVGWHLNISAEGAPTAACKPRRGWRVDLDAPLGLARRDEGAAGSQCERQALDPPRRPTRFGDPPTRSSFILRLGPYTILHPDTKHGLVHDPGIDALQPVVPPAQCLLKEPDRWAGYAIMRIGVRPRTD